MAYATRAGILLSAQEMIIRLRKDRFIAEIEPMFRPKRNGGRQYLPPLGYQISAKYRRRRFYGRLYFIY